MTEEVKRIIAFGEALHLKAAKDARKMLGGDEAIWQMLLPKSYK